MCSNTNPHFRLKNVKLSTCSYSGRRPSSKRPSVFLSVYNAVDRLYIYIYIYIYICVCVCVCVCVCRGVGWGVEGSRFVSINEEQGAGIAQWLERRTRD